MPASIATIDNVQDILKEMTDKTSVEDLVLSKAPELGIFPKRTDFAGKYAPLPFAYAPIAGVSPDFGAAMATKADMVEDAFQITTNDMFALFSLNHKAVKATRNDAGAFYDLVTSRSKSAMTAFKKVMAHAVYGNGGGALGRIASNGGTTITLQDRSSMWVLDKNMTIVPATGDGTSGVLGATQDVISAISRGGLQLTAEDGAFSNAAGEFAANNFIFLRGAFNNYIKGLDAWLPLTAPGATPFFTVVRNQDDRMGGVRRVGDTSVDANLEEFLISLAADISDFGGVPDIVLMSNQTFARLRKLMGTKVEYSRVSGTSMDGDVAKFSFRSIKLVTDVGEIDIVPSRNCPANRVYMLQKDTWIWWSMGNWMDWLTYEDDDSKFVRHNAENAMEARLGGYMQLACNFPSANGVGDITVYNA